MVLEGFRLCQRGLCNQIWHREALPGDAMLWQGSLRLVALWAGTGPICGRQTCSPTRPASPGAVALTRLFENAMDVMQIQPLLASTSCIL